MSDSEPKQSWWKRLSGGLKRTSSALGTAITDLVTKRKLDAASIEDLEGALIRADLGVDLAMRISDKLGAGRYEKGIAPEEVQALLADEISSSVWPLVEDGSLRPVMDRSFPLGEAAAAHGRMEAGDHIGKIVLDIG